MANDLIGQDFDRDAATRSMQDDGHVVLRGVIDRQQLAHHTQLLFDAFDRANAMGPLFSGGGGMIMGHLNCFPGRAAHFVYQTLIDKGIIDWLREYWPEAKGEPNVGCNFNLPRSQAQNYHADGYAENAFPVINIASVDTDLVNGALDILERTHDRSYKYWEIVWSRPTPKRVPVSQGDVIIRSSALWHRGMPNRSCRARPMLALTWEDGGNFDRDPWDKNGGEIAFYPNRYATNWGGRVLEQGFALAPGVNSAARLAMSFFR